MTSRTEALDHLSRFQERVPACAYKRNFDRSGHAEVSCLSKWIRYRAITEEECVSAVLANHPFEVAEKFVQELLWRTYWKGWLELHPQVWDSYHRSCGALHEEFATHERYRQAAEGRTGLVWFDDWVKELQETGYLHNHTRMWFASVWIFTLELPWQLGADFMYRHLLDGDSASNTLSWRWVGGLHTPGKIYVARPENIEKYSEGRWRPSASELNLNPRPLPIDEIGGIVPLEPVSTHPPRSGECVLVHDDDMSADLSLEVGVPHLSFLQWCGPGGSRSHVVNNYRELLRRDTRDRSHAVVVETEEGVIQAVQARSSQVLHIVKPHCGDLQGSIAGLQAMLERSGIRVILHRRAWDETYFPLAGSGFFPFWTAVKRRLDRGR